MELRLVLKKTFLIYRPLSFSCLHYPVKTQNEQLRNLLKLETLNFVVVAKKVVIFREVFKNHVIK